MVHTQAATQLSAVQVEHRGSVSDVWLRKNIRDDVADEVYGSDVTYWEADEVYGTLEGSVTEDEVAERFNELWDQFEEDVLTDREVTEKRGSEISDAMADLAETVSDGAVDVADIANAIADLAEVVSELSEVISNG